MVFSEARLNTGYDPLERPTKGTLPTGRGPTCGQLALIVQPNPTQILSKGKLKILSR